MDQDRDDGPDRSVEYFFSIAPIDAVRITLFVTDLDPHSLLSTVCM